MEYRYYFCLDFCTYFFKAILKGCLFPYILQKTHENRTGESIITACQSLDLWGSKSKIAETQFPLG